MKKDGKQEILDVLAQIVSFIFHPLFMPVYGMAIIFSAPTLIGYLPFGVKRLLFLIVLINNVLLPLSVFPFLIHMNIINSWTIDARRERIIPLVITSILYSATSFIIYKLPVPGFLKSFIIATSLLSLIVTVINLWFKISLHSVGSGALVAIVLIFSLKMHTPVVWYLLSVIIAGGLVLSSRLKLNLHNPWQVWSGFFTGFIGLILFMMFS
jgi:hypothetical protein